uniref:Uncharacterized protein n=1 Tax=Anopheles atroparvus TaxID=41427 RepID=A0AAG5DDI0_ANOAO
MPSLRRDEFRRPEPAAFGRTTSNGMDQIIEMICAHNDKCFKRIVRRLLCHPSPKWKRGQRQAPYQRRRLFVPPLRATSRDLCNWQHRTQRLLFRPFPPLATILPQKRYPDVMYG